MAAFEGIVGWFVFDITLRMQRLQAFVIGCLGADFANPHDFITGYANRVLKTVAIPELK